MAESDTSGTVHVVCCVINAILCIALAVYFSLFSCFHEIFHFDQYGSDIFAGIYSVTAVAFIVCVVFFLFDSTRYSTCVRYLSQAFHAIFGIGFGFIFGVSIFSILMLAHQGQTDGEIRAAEKVFTPDQEAKEVVWEKESTNGEVCNIQKNLGCMMWTRSDCILPDVIPSPGSSSTTTTTSATTTTTTSTTTAKPKNATADAKPICVICGLTAQYNFTDIKVREANNETATRPPTCFQAVLSCFAQGTIKGKKTAHDSERFLLIAVSCVLLVLTVVSMYCNAVRRMKELAGYGVVEHGGSAMESDYLTLSGGGARGY